MYYPKKLQTDKRSALKGFTLIELIVVIAIMLILMSILGIAISGFVNDAKREAANGNAQIISSAVQKALTEYEISGVELADLVYTDTKGTASKGDDVPASLFNVAGGHGVGTIPKDYFSGDTSEKKIKIGEGSDEGAYAEIMKFLPKSFEGGAFFVKFNEFQCTVDFVMYTSDKEADGTYDDKYFNSNKTQLQNINAQKTLQDSGHLVGCYPYADDN